ncbi:hypothetical protein L1049_014519 [Liquidambar formosana]|uniref:Uncharacterized protein n=1 Tax=Liquidambar formosana TaxID=63359 RepID=A0AAP0RWN7_LIQFO
MIFLGGWVFFPFLSVSFWVEEIGFFYLQNFLYTTKRKQQPKKCRFNILTRTQKENYVGRPNMQRLRNCESVSMVLDITDAICYLSFIISYKLCCLYDFIK